GPMGRLFAWPFRLLLAGTYRSGLRPWQLTLGSLGTNVVIGWLLLSDRRLVPGILLIPAGLFDILDGAIARLRGEESRFGAFLDPFLDGVGKVIFLGCFYWSFAGQARRLEAGPALGASVTWPAGANTQAEA